mmetsp:Transcript_102257/g.305299  ORF Transcript_102257/g.305299 Transcript_102257/m.305299 type:complete len:222 (+) Transcript_102257:641-1306(+)
MAAEALAAYDAWAHSLRHPRHEDPAADCRRQPRRAREPVAGALAACNAGAHSPGHPAGCPRGRGLAPDCRQRPHRGRDPQVRGCLRPPLCTQVSTAVAFAAFDAGAHSPGHPRSRELPPDCQQRPRRRRGPRSRGGLRPPRRTRAMTAVAFAACDAGARSPGRPSSWPWPQHRTLSMGSSSRSMAAAPPDSATPQPATPHSRSPRAQQDRQTRHLHQSPCS